MKQRPLIATLIIGLGVALVASLFLVRPPDARAADTVTWDGGFDHGSVPHGSNGAACSTGAADGPDAAADQYSSTQEAGNTACTNSVTFTSARTRSADSAKSLKEVIAAHQQREALVSKHTWKPDAVGSVDEWYGFSIYYDTDWNLGGGLSKEVSGSVWHAPIAWRCDCSNGSLNLSGDMNDSNGVAGETVHSFTTPHMFLRRNSVRQQQGFYTDGKGLDKIDLGPIVVGKWMDFVVHVRWSTTTNGALREAWRDGVYMGKRTSLNAVDTSTERLRVGQYQTTSIAHARTSYFDNVRIGTSYAAVDPTRATAGTGAAPTSAAPTTATPTTGGCPVA